MQFQIQTLFLLCNTWKLESSYPIFNVIFQKFLGLRPLIFSVITTPRSLGNVRFPRGTQCPFKKNFYTIHKSCIFSASVPSFMAPDADRIIRGNTAPSPIPWQVSLRVFQSGANHFCGGTILDSRTVLSAAHCFFSKYHYLQIQLK